MKPTVSQCKVRAAEKLGDRDQEYFTSDVLQEPFAESLEELGDEMLKAQLPYIELVTTYTLSGGSTSLDPADASITNFGELVRIEERVSTGPDRYVELEAVDPLPDREKYSDSLVEYTWRGDVFYFVGATNDVVLRITYLASAGAAPTDDETVIAIDGALRFLGLRTAYHAAKSKGYTEADDLDVKSAGPNRDFRGGAAHALLLSMVRSKNKVKLQRPAYSAGAQQSVDNGRPPYNY